MPPALENIREAEQSSHSHPLDSTTFGGTFQQQVDGEVRTISLGHFYYGKMRDSFVVVPPTLDFQRQVKRSLKPPTQVGVDGDGYLIESFPFNTKGARRSAVLRLAKTTHRRSLSLSQRVTSSCNTTSIVYKFSESSEETSAITSTTTASVLDDIHPDGNKCEQCTDGSGSNTSEMSTGSDDTKSLSVIPDTEDEGSVVNLNDAPVSPVFGVQGPSSFSTEYPEDSSNAFSSQGLVEVDKLGSSMGDCSEDLFSDADQHEQVILMEMEDTHEQTETGTFSEKTLVKNPEDVHSIEMTNLQGTKKRHIVDPTAGLPLKKRLLSQEGKHDKYTYPDHCPFKTKSNTYTGVEVTNSGDTVHDISLTVNLDESKDVLIGTGLDHCDTACNKSSLSEGVDDKQMSPEKSLTVNLDESKDVLIGTGLDHCDTACDKSSLSEGVDDKQMSPEKSLTVNLDESKDVLIGTGLDHCDTACDKSSLSEGVDDKQMSLEKSLTVNLDESKDVLIGTGSDHSDTTFDKSSLSEGVDDKQMSPEKSLTVNLDESKDVLIGTGSHPSDTACDKSSFSETVEDIITFRKKHFIVQDLGVGEMVAEGKSKVHIHVSSKSEFRSLLQRLIVKIGENKGWEVVLENIPYVKIPNIDNLVNQSQNGVVMYSDIALDSLLKTQSGDSGSNVAPGSMDIDCITTSNGEQQPNLKSPNLNVDSNTVGDGKEITIEGESSGTEDSSSDSTSSGSSGTSGSSSSSSSSSSESDKKPESLAADVENLKSGERNEKPNVHNSVDKPDSETACPPEPENNDKSDPETACPLKPENNDKPDPETACPPEPENNDSVPPDDVFGECLLLKKLMRAKETESLSSPGSGKVQTYSKITFMMLQIFIKVID